MRRQGHAPPEAGDACVIGEAEHPVLSQAALAFTPAWGGGDAQVPVLPQQFEPKVSARRAANDVLPNAMSRAVTRSCAGT